MELRLPLPSSQAFLELMPTSYIASLGNPNPFCECTDQENFTESYFMKFVL